MIRKLLNVEQFLNQKFIFFIKIIVKFGHALVILGNPIVSRINEDYLGKKFNVPQNRVVYRHKHFF